MISGILFTDIIKDYSFEKSIKPSCSSYHDCQLIKNDFNNLRLIWQRNRKLPYEIKDLAFRDDKNEVLLFMLGNIYSDSLGRYVNNQLNTNPLQFIYDEFKIKGPEFVRELNGDFIIIIYESVNDKLYIFRDHLGIYPLSFALINGALIFSSDIIQLCSFFQNGGLLNSEFFMSEFRFADLTCTPNQKVRKLLPGHYIFFSNGKLEIVKYWEPEKIKINNDLSKQQVYYHLKYLVEDSIRIRSDKRFRASAHLSGGLDSSVVAALTRKEYAHQETFYGYSWTSDNFEPEKVEFDERNLIRKTCEKNNIHPVFIDLKPEDYYERSKNYVRNFGAFAEEKVIEHAKKNGINLIFSGWGGDEFISKGERGINTDLLLNMNWSLFFKRNPIIQPKKFIRTILYDILFPAINIVNFGQRKAHKKFTRYLKSPFKKNHYPSVKKFLFYRSRRQLHLGFLYHYHIPARTEVEYINGFLNGVEYRYPLLDKRIVEFMLSVPSKFLVEGKYSRMILREISKGLVPDGVTWVRKGIDPVYHASIKKNCFEAAMNFINRIDQYESNSDLHFINFGLIKKDIIKFKKKNKYSDEFINNMIIINNLHEFIKRYRNKELFS